MPRFDEVFDIIDSLLREALPHGFSDIVVVRDVTGATTVVLPNDSLSDTQEWNSVAERLHAALGPYSPGPKQVLLRHSDLIAPEDVLSSPDRIRLPDNPDLFLVDRLLTNQDWLRRPVLEVPGIPTAVAFSVKGGVGRSTAFATWAWYLARLGKRVIVVDLDLEAPGIGTVLLDALPDYGMVDWFVEALAGQADASLLEDMLAQSPLAADTAGTIHAIPAFGAKTRDYVGKVGRAYTPTLTTDGGMQGFAHRLAALIQKVANRLEPPDALLLDARAGLHDIGAAAVTQVGAEVFLFARDEPPSWDAYERLFDHLRMARTVQWGMPDDDLRWRLKMVAAQIDGTEGALEHWIDASYTSWSRFYDNEDEDKEADKRETRAQTFERTDPSAPHHPLTIFFDPRMRGLSLVTPGKRPEWSSIEGVFGGFLKGATARLFAAGATTPGEEPEL